jgi:hypothetical protein
MSMFSMTNSLISDFSNVYQSNSGKLAGQGEGEKKIEVFYHGVKSRREAMRMRRAVSRETKKEGGPKSPLR